MKRLNECFVWNWMLTQMMLRLTEDTQIDVDDDDDDDDDFDDDIKTCNESFSFSYIIV